MITIDGKTYKKEYILNAIRLYEDLRPFNKKSKLLNAIIEGVKDEL